MKKLMLPLLGLLLFACKKKENNTPATNTAGVMFVNGCAGTTNLNATVNAAVVATNMSPGNTSGYKFVTEGNVALAFTVSGINSALVSGTKPLAAGGRYSVFCGGLLTDPHFVFAQDDLSAPPANNAKIRFINLSPDNANFTVNVGSVAIDSGVSAYEVTSFHYVTSGQSNVRIGDPANISTVMDAGTKQMDAGKSYTLMLTGTASGSGSGGLTLTLFNHN